MASRYWVGGTALWDATAGSKWATTSGGVGGAAVPTTSDAVFFDGNSGVGNCSVNGTVATPGDLNFTGYLGTFTQASNINMGSATTGDLILGAGMTFAYVSGQIKLSSTKAGNTLINTAGITIGNVAFNGAGATFLLQTHLLSSGSIAPSGGTVDMNGFNMTCATLSNGNTTTRSVNMRGGTITITGTGAVFDAPAGVLTYSWTAGARFLISNTSATAKTFAGGTNTTLPIIEVAGAASAGLVTFSGAFTAAGIKLNPDSNVKFTVSTTYTLSTFVATGTSGHAITIQSTSAGTAFTLSIASGTISCDYLSLKDSTATGGALFYAGANSTNVSGNTGWRFVAVPALPSLATLQVWFDAAQITGKSNGDAISLWPDMSGNGFNAATDGQNPHYITNVLNGKPAIRFETAATNGSGVSQTMRAFPTTLGVPYTVFVVARMRNPVGTTGRIFSSIYPAAQNWLMGWWNGFERVMYAEGFITAGATGITGNWHAYTSQGTGSLTTWWESGVQIDSNTNGLAGMNGAIALSGYGTTSSGQLENETSDFDMVEVIAYSSALNTTDRQTVEAYLQAKYFATFTPSLLVAW